MKKITLALFALVLFCSHVMYLKFDTYFLEPNTSATIQLFNGTFDKSENVITRDRMLDASLVGNGDRIEVSETQWGEKDSITLLNFQTGDSGTWIAGISTAPRSIEMEAEAFNTYLEHEGIPDMLTWRRDNNALANDAVEKYSKHVKTIFQVGAKKTNDWQTVLGYPIEFVPVENPYELNTGDSLKVKLLFKGKPLANQLVIVDYKAPADGHTHDEQESNSEHGHSHEGDNANAENDHSHATESQQTVEHSNENDKEHSHTHAEDADQGHTHEDIKKSAEHSHDTSSEHGHSHTEDAKTPHSHDDQTEHGHSHDEGVGKEHSHDQNDTEEPHQHTSGQQLRTDSDGLVTVDLAADGIWYLQTIHLVNTEEEGFTHESNWTTLTFEVVHGHGEDTHTHENEDESGIPSYAYWIGSLFLVGILFFWFNRKN